MDSSSFTVESIRASLGEGEDGESIRHLAALSQSVPPEAAVVLAEVCGEPVAAVAIRDGQTGRGPLALDAGAARAPALERPQVRLIGSIWSDLTAAGDRRLISAPSTQPLPQPATNPRRFDLARCSHDPAGYAR